MAIVQGVTAELEVAREINEAVDRVLTGHHHRVSRRAVRFVDRARQG